MCMLQRQRDFMLLMQVQELSIGFTQLSCLWAILQLTQTAFCMSEDWIKRFMQLMPELEMAFGLMRQQEDSLQALLLPTEWYMQETVTAGFMPLIFLTEHLLGDTRQETKYYSLQLLKLRTMA